MSTDLSWYMKYCPKIIDDYIFQNNEQQSIIKNWIENEYIDGNVLLYGPAGVGKTALSEILIRTLIKHEYDLKVIKSRSVNQIDELYNWSQTSPLGSKKKIIYIEEFDKLSSTALTTMKDSLLEKFQSNVTYICNTNFINKIDKAIVSRFNFRFNLTGNKEDYLKRILFILNTENVSFKEELVKEYVYKNYNKGLRNLITSIQIGSISGILNLDESITELLEEDIIKLTIGIYSKVFNVNKIETRKIVFIDPLNSIISKEYGELIEIIQYNSDIDWNYVFLEIERRISFLPIKLLISKYLEGIDHKKIPYIHYISFIYESMKSIMDIG